MIMQAVDSTVMTTTVSSVCFCISSLRGNTEANAIAAEAPQMATTPAVNTPMAGLRCSPPKNTPPAVVSALCREAAAALAAPELKARLLQLNLANAPRKTPEQFAQTVRDDLKVWTKIAQDNKITPDD